MHAAQIVGSGAVGRGLARLLCLQDGVQDWQVSVLQKQPQRERDLLWTGDRRRWLVWTWRSPFAPQHRPCVVGPVIFLSLSGCRGVCRTKALTVTCNKARVQSDGHVSGDLPVGSKGLPCSKEC